MKNIKDYRKDSQKMTEFLKKKIVVKAVRNVQRGYEKDEDEKSMFRPGVKLDLSRSRYFTESYQETDGEPMVMRRAKALEKLLSKVEVNIQDWEKIVGTHTEDPHALFHPIDMNYRSVLRLVNSPQGETLLDSDEKAEFEEYCKYWKGKCMSDRHQNLFSGDLERYWKYEGTFLWSHWSALGIPDYEQLFKEGFIGRIKKAEDRLKELDETVPVDYVDQKEFLEAVIISLQTVVDFAKRYSALAKEKSLTESDEIRKKELEDIAAICEWVPANPPRTFHEALQFFWFVHLVRYMEYSTLGIGIRFDHLLGPYYEKDLKNGNITYDEGAKLIQMLWVKFNELGLVYSPLVTSVYGGVQSLQAITLGGTDKMGKDVTNALTYLVLDCAVAMRQLEPSIAMRIHQGTPDELWVKLVDVIKEGLGYPSLFNDEALIPLLKKWEVKDEDVQDYAVTGCVYMEIPGKNIVKRTVGYFVLPKCLYWALHQGKNPETGEQWGAQTPDPATFRSWEDVLNAYTEQVKFFAQMMMKIENTCRELYRKYLPRPFYSAVIEGCIENGKDTREWKYPSMVHDFVQQIGATNVADSITAIKKIVFEDKQVSLPTLLSIMDQNWEGHEELRQACINAPKYGNDDDYADDIAKTVQIRTEEAVETAKDRFGDSLRGDGSAVSATYGLAFDTPATPEGRKNGEAFSDATLSPIPGADQNGPTAVLKSVAKIPTYETHNHLLNQKFPPALLENDNNKEAFINYLKSWRELGISHNQFNIIDKETLIKAQEEPEKYPDLIVRVAGYSAFFVDLTKGLQDHIIARSEQEFRS